MTTTSRRGASARAEDAASDSRMADARRVLSYMEGRDAALQQIRRDSFPEREAARAEWMRDQANAYKNDPMPAGFGSGESRGQKAGDLCTIDGQPGHLNEQLVCVPDRRADALPRTMSASDAEKIKERAWREMLADQANAWKGDKA